MTNVECKILLSEAQDRVKELEVQLAERTREYDIARMDLRHANRSCACLGAKNATLREHASAMWARWADALWHSDDAARPAQPEDCATDAAWLVLFQRAAEVMAEGAREIETLEGEKREGAEAIFALADKLAEMQAEGRL